MGRSIRYWFRNMEEMVLGNFVILGIFLIMQRFVFSNGVQLGAVGFMLMLIQGVCMLALSMQSLQQISINVIFGNTRRDSLKAMHLAMIAGLTQIEVIQILLYLMPFVDKDIQFIAICYTPVVFLVGNGMAYFISWLQLKSEKVYKVIFIIFCMMIGAVMGMTGAMSGELVSVLENMEIINVLNGEVLLICGIVAVILYVIGGYVHGRGIRNMDVRI